MKETLYNLIRQEVRGQQAYAAQTVPVRIRLDANENSYEIPREIRSEFMDALARVELNRYPEAGSLSLRNRFASAFGVESGMLMMGNGSDELIQILCTALAPATVMVPSPTFVMYRITAMNNGHLVLEAPLDGDFDLDIEAMLKAADGPSPRLIFLSYPNNPTGNCFSPDRIRALLEEVPGFVVVDEAYGCFTRNSFLPLLERYENLIILKTLSKIGLAAMRIGFLLGQPSLVRELDKVRLPYNINALSQVAAGFYLDHEEVFLDQAAEIIRAREKLFRALGKIEGIRPYHSEANFIFFSCLFNTDQVYEALKNQGILIKNFNTAGNLKNFMRVTVGKPDENELFLCCLQDILSKLGA